MPRSHAPYPEEFRRRMVELVRSGRTPEALSREFEPSAQAIHNWVRQADLDEGRRSDGLTTEEREELRRLRREVVRLTPGAGDSGKSRGLVCSGDRLGAGEVFEFVKSNRAAFTVFDDVPGAGCLLQRVLRVGAIGRRRVGRWRMKP